MPGGANLIRLAIKTQFRFILLVTLLWTWFFPFFVFTLGAKSPESSAVVVIAQLWQITCKPNSLQPAVLLPTMVPDCQLIIDQSEASSDSRQDRPDRQTGVPRFLGRQSSLGDAVTGVLCSGLRRRNIIFLSPLGPLYRSVLNGKLLFVNSGDKFMAGFVKHGL